MHDRPRGDRRPLVVCRSCEFAWHSPHMAEGLRLLGSCPRCDGTLEFADEQAAARPQTEPEPAEPQAPHLVLGLPRPPRR